MPNTRAQYNKTPYPNMAPLVQYLMAHDAEIALARTAAMAASGDLGYTYGTWVYTSKDKDKEGKTAVAYGKFRTIWKKQKDGQWKVALNITNSSPAAKNDK